MSDRAQRWQEVKRVLGVVLDQKPSARQKFLERICGHDRALLEEVRALLESHDEDYLESPLVDRSKVEESQPSLPADQPPERVKSFRLVETIGYGGMGVVYRVVDGTGANFALKRIPSKGLSETARRRFQREAKLASSLRHPNIVAIESFGEQDGDPYLIMEYLEGATLDDSQGDGDPSSLDSIRDVARQVAFGLAYAHDNGVVHRDLKPSNLFRTRDGVIKILDFGIAKPVGTSEGSQEPASKLTKTGEVLGTPDYMAPEQAIGAPVDGRSDLYSLGAILYELLSGRLAVTGESLAARITSLLNEEPVPLSEFRQDLPKSLESLVHDCLKKKPDARPASARAFLEALGRLDGR